MLMFCKTRNMDDADSNIEVSVIDTIQIEAPYIYQKIDSNRNCLDFIFDAKKYDTTKCYNAGTLYGDFYIYYVDVFFGQLLQKIDSNIANLFYLKRDIDPKNSGECINGRIICEKNKIYKFIHPANNKKYIIYKIKSRYINEAPFSIYGLKIPVEFKYVKVAIPLL